MDETRIREIAREEMRRVTRTPLAFPLDIDSLHTLKKGGFILFGTATLVSGVATVADRRIQASSTAVVSYIAPAGTMGANLKSACTLATLTITAIKTDKTTETSDTSTVAYFVIL